MERCQICGGEGRHEDGCPKTADLGFKKPSDLFRSAEFGRRSEQSMDRETRRLFEEYLEREDGAAEGLERYATSIIDTGRLRGSGAKGDFYSNDEYKVGVKFIARPEKRGAHETQSIAEEAALQIFAGFCVDRWNARPENAKKQAAKVPKVIGYVSDSSKKHPGGQPHEYLLMEPVMGKTVSHLVLQEVFRKLSEQYPEKVSRPSDKEEYVGWSEETLAQMVRAYFSDVTFSHRRISKMIGQMSDHERGVAFYAMCEGSGIIDQPVVAQSHFFTQAVNKSGFFHRDLHERNIMVAGQSAGSQQAYVIDFGTAAYIPNLAGDDVRDYSDAYGASWGQELTPDTQIRDALPRFLAKKEG